MLRRGGTSLPLGFSSMAAAAAPLARPLASLHVASSISIPAVIEVVNFLAVLVRARVCELAFFYFIVQHLKIENGGVLPQLGVVLQSSAAARRKAGAKGPCWVPYRDPLLLAREARSQAPSPLFGMGLFAVCCLLFGVMGQVMTRTLFAKTLSQLRHIG